MSITAFSKGEVVAASFITCLCAVRRLAIVVVISSVLVVVIVAAVVVSTLAHYGLS